MKSSKPPRFLSPELPSGLCPGLTGKLNEFTALSDPQLNCTLYTTIARLLQIIFSCFIRVIMCLFVVLCAIWYHSYNLKNVRNAHRGVLLSVKLQGSACNLTKSNTPPWVFFTFFKLCT